VPTVLARIEPPCCMPLPCCLPGITCWTPLKDYDLGRPGVKLAVVGLGGLGHMAVKLGRALGCEVGAATLKLSDKICNCQR